MKCIENVKNTHVKNMGNMKNVKKSRRGAALIIALLVMVVCGFFITIIFNFVTQHGIFSQAERGMYVNHTTLVSHLQSMVGRITADNLAANSGQGETRHTEALAAKRANPGSSAVLKLEDLRFGGPDDADDWYVYEKVNSGLGVQYVEVEVYDMFFEQSWIDPNVLENPDCPPTFNMVGRKRGPKPTNDLQQIVDNTILGGSAGTNVTLDNYGAYLVRARLYDQRGKPGRRLRTVEEAFVQRIGADG